VPSPACLRVAQPICFFPRGKAQSLLCHRGHVYQFLKSSRHSACEILALHPSSVCGTCMYARVLSLQVSVIGAVRCQASHVWGSLRRYIESSPPEILHLVLSCAEFCMVQRHCYQNTTQLGAANQLHRHRQVKSQRLAQRKPSSNRNQGYLDVRATCIPFQDQIPRAPKWLDRRGPGKTR
jgi:hypothetical protein